MTDMPSRVWLRVSGGGISMPGSRIFQTVTGDSIEHERRTMYVRADLVEPLVEALRIIAGRQQCIDNLMSNADVARAALSSWEAAR